MKMKTSELSGSALDWAVAEALGMQPEIRGGSPCCESETFVGKWPIPSWSARWSQGGPLIEAMVVDIENDGEWSAYCFSIEDDQAATMAGNTPLIATCRAIVAAKLGDEVDVPDELL